jgi:tyrosinase
MVDTVIDKPTYVEHVRHFFDDVDLQHMFKLGYDLTTHPTLKVNAEKVKAQTDPSHPTMPKLGSGELDVARLWSQERWQSFKNWMDTGFPSAG